MTREEILEKSRNSGKGNFDEREQQLNATAGARSQVFAMFLCILINLLNTIFDGPRSVGNAAWMIWSGMYAAKEIYLAKNLCARSHKVYAILFCLFTVVEFAFFIYALKNGI